MERFEVGANQNTTRDESPVTEIIQAKKQDEQEDAKHAFGLLIDTEAAARNRERLERERVNEVPPWREGRSEPLLPKPKQTITQEVIKEDMYSKYDSLIPVILEDLKTMNLTQCEKKNGIAPQCLSGMLKHWQGKGMIPSDYIAPCKVSHKSHPRKTKKLLKPVAKLPDKLPEAKPETKRPIVETEMLPAWNESWGDVIKLAWLRAWEAANTTRWSDR